MAVLPVTGLNADSRSSAKGRGGNNEAACRSHCGALSIGWKTSEMKQRGRIVPQAIALTIPEDPLGVVAFAHGSGSSRLSPRNRQVAEALNENGFATLLFDLLTGEEELDRANVFDIPLLGRRLAAASGWVRHQPETSDLPLGYFGASTGAAAALIAAADLGATGGR